MKIHKCGRDTEKKVNEISKDEEKKKTRTSGETTP